MRRRAMRAKYVGFVAPSRRKRSQSGSSGRSPAFGARKPFGVVSAPTTRATSHSPARMRARAASRAWRPTRRRRSWSTPGRRSSRGPGRSRRRRRSRRSRCGRSRRRRRTARRATRCRRRPARRGPPRRRTRRSCGPTCPTASCRRRRRRRRRSCRRQPPLPDRVLVLVVLEERVDDELDPRADVEVGHARRRRRPGRARRGRRRRARRRRGRTARTDRSSPRTAAAAGTGRRCSSTPCRSAPAGARRTRVPAQPGFGAEERRPAGRRPCRSVVQRAARAGPARRPR